MNLIYIAGQTITMEESNNDYSISFCTVSMNRLHHIKETLPKNISDNIGGVNIEFVILDYNSSDGLGEWMKENMGAWIGNGLVAYYRTQDREDFDRAHSRNMAFRLSKGDIICNIDADNFTGRDFAAYLKREFSDNSNMFLCAGDVHGKDANSNVLGRISMLRRDFILTEGFDELMRNYGFEDQDLINRLERAGRTKRIITEPLFLRSINHKVDERIENEYLYKNLRFLFVNYINPSVSELLFLLKNGSFVQGRLVNNHTINADRKEFALTDEKHLYEFSLMDDTLIHGSFSKIEEGFLMYKEYSPEVLKYNPLLKAYEPAGNESAGLFYMITDQDMIREAVFFFSQIANRIKMTFNSENGSVAVNNSCYGKGTAYKNFDLENPVIL